MDGQQIIEALRNPSIGMSKAQVREAWALLKVRNGQLEELGAQFWKPGDDVEFDARGTVHRGTVKKVNTKSVSVAVGALTWKVSPSLLRKAD